MPAADPPRPSLAEWHARQLETFIEIQPALQDAAEELRGLLRRIANEAAPHAAVHVRVKTLLSVSEKILRGSNPSRHPEPMSEDFGLTDLVGGQIITYTRRDTEAVCRRIERLAQQYRPGSVAGGLEIDHRASEDTASRLLPDQFGYTSRHYIIRLHGSELLGQPIASASGCGRKMEVQITSALSHAWGAVTHDRTYKSDLRLPERMLRRVAEAKAMLDAAERQLEEAVVDLDMYRRKHAGRLWATASSPGGKQQFERAMLVNESILAMGLDLNHDAHGSSVVDSLQSLAELAMAQGDWQRAIDCLNQAVQHRPTLATRLAEAYQHAGQMGAAESLLTSQLERDPTDRAAACALAEICLSPQRPMQDAFDRAAAVLERAFLAQPDEPELLMAYSTARLLRDRDASRLCTMRGVFNAAIEECRKRFEIGTDVPECLLQHARLALYADDLFDSVNTYCLAFLHEPTPVRLEQEHRHITLLRERVAVDPAEPRVVALRTGLECVQSLLDLLMLAHSLKDDEAALSADEQRASLFSRRPLVILAGGCGAMTERHREQAEPLLESALGRFHGTVICGGTTSGVSGIVGRAAAASRRSSRAFVSVGYLPPAELVAEAGDRIDNRYDHLVHVAPAEPSQMVYSPLGPIRTWLDIIRAGIRPNEVRLIGVNGGRLSGFEFRLALALGATVGIVSDTGRAAAELLEDPTWASVRRPAQLMADADTLRFFMGPADISGHNNLDDHLVELLAQKLHEDYRRAQLRKPEVVHPSAREWHALDEAYRHSTREQARSLAPLLATEGFEIVQESDDREAISLGISDPQDPTQRIPNPDFEEQLTRLARLEHARWNAERLALGWTLGPTRDLAAKTSPYLLPFDDLPPSIQRYDFVPFISLPESLNALDPIGQRWKVVKSR